MDFELLNHLVAVRREIHENPEMGYQEHNTAKIICRELDKLNIPYQAGIAKTGIIATLKKGDGKCIAIKADMDALPIQEETGLNYSSKNSGIMHACGHDVHTAILIGAATLLKKKDFTGTVKFIFQPSEEGNYDDPERKSGGQRITESEEFNGIDLALALHTHPLIDVGKIAYKLGQALACANVFKITIIGKTGHAGAAPQLGIDAIYVASNIIQTAQSIITRYTSPIEPVVISFSKINGGTAPNIIADKVEMEGTIRALDLATYLNVLKILENMLTGISQTFGAKIEIDYLLNYPSLLNDKNLHTKLLPALEGTFQKENIIEIEAMLGGDDFAFYSRKVPSMYYFLGAQNNAEECFFLHHPKVIINEDCIKYGVDFFVKGVNRILIE